MNPYQVNIQLTRRAYGGLIAAANVAGVSPQEFCRQLLEESGINYANMSKYRIGILLPSQFIDKLSAQELATIKQIAEQNNNVKILKDQLVEREEPLKLDDPALLNGLTQLANAGLLSQNRPTELVSFDIPIPLYN